MKNNRCKCGRKKEKGVEACIKCLSKELLGIPPIPAPESFVEVIEKECSIEAKLDEAASEKKTSPAKKRNKGKK